MQVSPSVVSLMQPGVVAVESGATVSEVARIMRQKSVRDVFVMKEGEPIGLVRDWDIITGIVANNYYPDLVKVDEIMYAPAPAVTPYAELSDVAGLMAESGVRAVLVTEGGKTLGTITSESLISIAPSLPKGSLHDLYRNIQRET